MWGKKNKINDRVAGQEAECLKEMVQSKLWLEKQEGT